MILLQCGHSLVVNSPILFVISEREILSSNENLIFSNASSLVFHFFSFTCFTLLLLLLLLLHLLDHSSYNCEKLVFHNNGIMMMNLLVTAALGSGELNPVCL